MEPRSLQKIEGTVQFISHLQIFQFVSCSPSIYSSWDTEFYFHITGYVKMFNIKKLRSLYTECINLMSYIQVLSIHSCVSFPKILNLFILNILWWGLKLKVVQWLNCWLIPTQFEGWYENVLGNFHIANRNDRKRNWEGGALGRQKQMMMMLGF